MSGIALQTAIERARTAALAGDAASFAELRRGIQTLDRDGSAPARELVMLSVVAAARLADLPGVEQGLASLQPIGPRDWETLRVWLLGAPELSLPAYAEFVQSLDRRLRISVKAPPARRWTPAIAIVLGGALLSLLLLGLRLMPRPPAQVSREAISATLDGAPATLLATLPAEWRTQLREAGERLAPHGEPSLRDATHASMALLARSLDAAATAPGAGRIAARLLGPRADGTHLARLAEGVRRIDDGPWFDPAAWSDEAWRWSPQGDALLAYRTLLRHLPLGVWATGWFAANWRCDPLATQDVAVHPTASDASQATIVVHIGMESWPATLARRDRTWVPRALLENWGAWAPELSPERCTAERTRALQQSIISTAGALEAWVRSLTQDPDAPPPSATQLPWWLP